MILLRTDLFKTEMTGLKPVLVDAKKQIIIDTLYGTGLNSTVDSCSFLFYDDFLNYRKAKTAVHYWYRYDTVYHFAAGYYLSKFNYCKYISNNSSLYIRFNNINSESAGYIYIKVAAEKRIHLHNYYRLLNDRNTGEIMTTIAPMIIFISREELGLQ